MPLEPLLKTKLHIPRLRAERVQRPHLTARLDASRHFPLTLVSAPAGFGKTTLLAEWATEVTDAKATENATTSPSSTREPSNTQAVQVAWVSLDDGDNDSSRFLAYLVAAFRLLRPGLAPGADVVLGTPSPPVPERILTELLNDLEKTPGSFALVLDDYHVITAQAVHDAVTFLLDHLPPGLGLMIATRVDPPLPLSRLRARNQLLELRAADVRFTLDEAAAFLNTSMGLPLSADDIATLEARTEGWIAGLQMAALSLQHRPDTTEFIHAFSGSHRHILDYLVDEVLMRQSEDVQTFLLHTSILDRMCGPLCDAVLNDDRHTPGAFISSSRSQAILEYLDRANLFLVPLDDDRRWYRYHHLFADLLRAQLQQRQPEAVTDLHARASEWYEQAGFDNDAIEHAFLAQDFERAARLIERNFRDMWQRSDPRFLPFAQQLPEDAVRGRLWLRAYRAMLLITLGHLGQAEALLHDTEARRVTQWPRDERDAVALMGVGRVYIADLLGRPSSIIEVGEQALEIVSEDLPPLRNTIAYWLGIAYYLRGRFGDAERVWSDSLRRDWNSQTTNIIAPSVSKLARMRAIQGRLDDAENICRETLRLMEERGIAAFYIGGLVPIALADILRERNDLRSAEELARRGLEALQPWPSPNPRGSAYATLARIQRTTGDADGATRTLADMDRLTAGAMLTPDVRAERDAEQVRLWLRQGDRASVEAWTAQALATEDSRLAFRSELDHLTLCRVLLAQGEARRANTLLTRLAEAAEAGGRIGRLIEILALQAIALEQEGDAAQALAVLSRALALAEPEGYVRVFLDEGEQMAALLSRANVEYAARLRALFKDASSPVECHAPRQASAACIGDEEQPAALVEPLSERELEVLRLLAAGLTTREIAARLFITPGTVKVHIHHIYGKLDVQNRVQAIARARELRLL